jgi:drug/metabolite transporter (DMT)-like permease
MKKAKVSAPLGASLVVLSSAFYASYGIWTKLMGNFFGGYTASALRSVLVLLLIIPFALAYKKIAPFKLRNNWPYWLGLIGFSFFIWGPLYFAILHAGIGISICLNYACLVIGMFLFGWLFAKEKFTKDKLYSALLGLGGMSLVFVHSISSLGWVPLLAAGLSGFCAAGVTVITKIIPYHTTQTTVSLWTSSAIANFIMLFVVSEKLPRNGWHIQWVYLLIFAAASIIASLALVRGVKLVDAGAAGILGLLEIVFGVGFGIAFFHEKLSVVVFAGILVIIAAAAVPYIKDYKAQTGSLS